MSEVFSFHLLDTSVRSTIRAVVRPPSSTATSGLVHAECMAVSKLGAPLWSPARLQLGTLAMIARWESDAALDGFLTDAPLGRQLADGWHVRLDFVRRWGSVREFVDPPAEAGDQDPEQPVAALTLARLKHSQIPRFIKWGTPVERLVVDHPAVLLAVAPMRPVRTVATCSVWRTQREMTDMVAGRSDVAESDRHAAAMAARDRKDFHREFTTLRFHIRSEHGVWRGRSGLASP